jgi:hypothetical protein
MQRDECTGYDRFYDCARITGNPHLTRRWPFGRVTEGLPINQTLLGKMTSRGLLYGEGGRMKVLIQA